MLSYFASLFLQNMWKPELFMLLPGPIHRRRRSEIMGCPERSEEIYWSCPEFSGGCLIPKRRRSKMTEREAYRILGLHPGAGEPEIKRKYRKLMQQAHPDHFIHVRLPQFIFQKKRHKCHSPTMCRHAFRRPVRGHTMSGYRFQLFCDA